MRMRCGRRWTQLPLIFCCGQKPEQEPASPAALNDDHTGPLAELLGEMATKNTDMQLWSWKLRVSPQISKLSPADAKELEEIYKQRREECNGKM
jgi:hypothetical protein